MQIRGADPMWGFGFVYKKVLTGVYLIRKKLDLDRHSNVGMGRIKFDRFKQHK